METILRMLEIALPVFITLAIGMVCRKKKILTRDGIKMLKTIAVNICLPFMLFTAFATVSYTAGSIAIPLTIYLLCVLSMLLGYAAMKIFRGFTRLTPFLCSSYEAGLLGFALFPLLFKGQSNSALAIIVLGQELFIFTIYKALINGRSGSVKQILLDAVKSPVLMAVFLGIITGATGAFDALARIGFSGVVESITSFVSAPASVLILITVGYDLVPSEIRWKKTAAVVSLRLAIQALLLCAAILINRLILKDAMHVGALVLMFILPPAYVVQVFADAEEERTNISSVLSVTTLITIALFIVLAAVI